MKEVKFHTLYSEPNGVREEIPALKGKDAKVFGVKVAGTDLVPDADGKVNVPLANSTTAGVAVVATWKGVEIASNGELRGVVVNGATYPTRGNDYILSKGTFENAKEDIIRRALVSNSQIADADKPAICETIGAYGQWVKIHESTLEEDAVQVSIPIDSKERRFLRIYLHGTTPVVPGVGAGTTYAQVFGAGTGNGSGIFYAMTQADRKNIWIDIDFSDGVGKIRGCSYGTYSNYGISQICVSMGTTLLSTSTKEIKLTSTSSNPLVAGTIIEVFEML